MDNSGHSITVICSNCGEELIGAVNRCWKCGTNFVRTTTRDTAANTSPHDFEAAAPPIRRAPVLAAYLQQTATEDTQAVMAVVIKDEIVEPIAEVPVETKAALSVWIDRGRDLLEWLPIDWPAIAGWAAASISCWISYQSIFGVLLGGGAVGLNVYLLNQHRNIQRRIGFGLAILALLFALGQLVSSIYFWSSGIPLSKTLFG